MIGKIKTVTEHLEFGDNLQCQLEFNPIEGKLEVMIYHNDHFDERLVTVANDDGSRRFSITGASHQTQVGRLPSLIGQSCPVTKLVPI